MNGRSRRRAPAPGAHPALSYRAPGYLISLRAGVYAMIIFVVIAVLYVSYWLVLAKLLRDGFDEWVQARRDAGAIAHYANSDLDGFPLRLRFTVDAPTYGPPPEEGGWFWEGEQVVATVRPWSPGRMTIRLPGLHRIEMDTGDGLVVAVAEARTLEAEFPMADAPWSGGTVQVAGLDASLGDDRSLAVDRLQVAVTPHDPGRPKHTSPTYDLAVEADDLEFSGGEAPPLGRRLKRLILDATLLGTLPPGPWPDSLVAWRDDGGTVEVTRFDLAYGPLAVEASGTVAVDEAIQPVGAFTARIRGFFQAVETLRERGVMRGRDAVTAKLVLGVLAKMPEDGGPAVLSTPLTLQERRLYAGPVLLTQLPAIRWSTADDTGAPTP